MNILVISKDTNKRLSYNEILDEVNRDRSEGWSDYSMEDLLNTPEEVLDWIDLQYHEVITL